MITLRERYELHDGERFRACRFINIGVCQKCCRIDAHSLETLTEHFPALAECIARDGFEIGLQAG